MRHARTVLVPRACVTGKVPVPLRSGSNRPWSESLFFFCQLSQIQQSSHQKIWVVDMVYIHNMNLVAVASTELKIGESLGLSRPALSF